MLLIISIQLAATIPNKPLLESKNKLEWLCVGVIFNWKSLVTEDSIITIIIIQNLN